MTRSVEAGMGADLILVFTIGMAELPRLLRRWLESWPELPTDAEPSLLAVHETPSGVSSLGDSIWTSVAEAAARVNLQLMRYRCGAPPEPDMRARMAA